MRLQYMSLTLTCETNPGNMGFNGYVDGVTIGTTGGGTTTYDFEPSAVPESTNTFGLLLVGMVALAGYLRLPRSRRSAV
jgi:hypothetical protein